MDIGHGIIALSCSAMQRFRAVVDLNNRERYHGLHHGVTYSNWLLNGPMEIYGNMSALGRER